MERRDLWKTQVAQSGDTVFDDACEGDIIVPVMGLTGAGKSTFINNYFNQENAAQVGHDLISCTTNLQAFCHPLPVDQTGKGRRLVLVDTPPFNHTDKSNLEILRRIAVWLASSYGPGKTCGGLIYLHDITDAQMRPPALQNLNVLQGLCGKKNLGSVVFGTTKSGTLTPEVVARREKQLSDEYWKDFTKQGAIVFKLLRSHESADELVRTVLDRVKKEEQVLLIQKELVDLNRTLPETEAGQALNYPLQEIIEHQNKALTGEELTDEQNVMHKNKIAAIGSQLQKLKLSFSRRLKKFFGLG